MCAFLCRRSKLSNPSSPTSKSTALYDLHVSQNARLVEFAGYSLPVQFTGIVAENLHTRSAASLFDVSHMGQVTVTGPDFATTALALETLLPGTLSNLRPGGMRYTVLLNEQGGIEDDFIVSRPAEGHAPEGTLFFVVNSASTPHEMGMFNRFPGPDIDFEFTVAQVFLGF